MVGQLYDPNNSFQVVGLALNANQFDEHSPAKNNEPSIIVWNTALGVLQRVSTLTNIVLEEIPNGLVKRLKMTVTQTGLLAPTSQDLENTLGAFNWKYNNTGDYSILKVGAFTNAKNVHILYSSNVSAGIPSFVTGITANVISADEIQILTRDGASGALKDDRLLNTSFTIEVYP